MYNVIHFKATEIVQIH